MRSSTPGEHSPRVVVLTTFDLDEYVYEGLRAGASGFLLKDAPEDQLATAIRSSPPAARSLPPR
jgi:DNA-binding NarL/FixJ family response regulator